LKARGQRVQAFLSIASSVDAEGIVAALKTAGAQLDDLRAGASEGVIARAALGSLELVLVRGAFGDVLAASQVVLGQAGTANEQAAGAGHPVVAALAQGENPQKMQWYRMRQKRLLGDALLVVPSTSADFAREVVALLDNPQRIAVMSRAGRDRMGNPGGAQAVAREALTRSSGSA
jgi:uncharacterized protein (TIGR03492 family)